MLKLETKEDKQLLESILHYVRAGGDVKRIRRMFEFCQKYNVDVERMAKAMQSTEASAIIQKIRQGYF